MPQVKLARSLGAVLCKELEIEDKTGKKFVEGATVNVSSDVAEELGKRNLIVKPDEPEEAIIKAPAPAPAIKAETKKEG